LELSRTRLLPVVLAAAVLTHGAGAATQSRPAPPQPRNLQERLAQVVTGGCLGSAKVGAAVVSLPDGRTVFESDAYAPLEPASTMKVLTTAAVLDRFGPDWRYATNIYADGPIEHGVLSGNLIIRGSGAPDLVIERWPEMAARISGLGITGITGDIVGDDSFFDGERRPPGWPPAANANSYNSPISALAANFNTVRVSVMPTAAGKRPTVLVEPFSPLIKADNRAKTGKRTSLRLGRSWNGRQNTISVTGTIGARSGPMSDYVAIEEPALATTSALQDALGNAGITVSGKAALGPTPPGATLLWTESSKPLWEIAADTNKNSNNFMAECLQRTLGADSFGAPGTRRKGADAVDGWLQRIGASRAGVTLFDGSGLAHANHLTARTLVDALVSQQADPGLGPYFVATLPICGVDGTLTGRLGDVAGQVRAKTGTISGARGLAGYVMDPGGQPRYAFAILVNAYRCGERTALASVDSFARALALDAAAPTP